MQTKKLLRLASRLRVSMAVLVGLGVGGTFTEFSSRAMFVLPVQPAAAFVSVDQPVTVSNVAGIPLARAVPNRRRVAQRLIPSISPSTVITEGTPSVGAETPVDALPVTGSGSAAPLGTQLASLSSIPSGDGIGDRTLPSPSLPGLFNDTPGQVTAATPDTPPPAVPEPPAWMLALAGLGLLAAVKYGKQYLVLQHEPKLA